ncbi:MAG TPA: pyruvate kinase, partial [Candidatus Thermoplasmatota archaeon]|nr:pyruvate kinase [Candidatus Thermoplasmatota archaeon]
MALPRTKIVATLGPSCDDLATLERMVRAGLSVARLNMAHGKHVDHARRIELARKAAQRAGRDIAIMGDIAGPKLRIGAIKAGKLTLQAGKTVVLTTRDVDGDADELSVSEPSVLRDIRVGEPVFLADGSLELRAVATRPTETVCRVVNGGLLLPRKGINLPRTRLRLPALTPQDVQDLRFAVHAGFDALALSFVRDVADLRLARKHLGRFRIPLIAKIEKREATNQLRAILDEADGAMVARGDLAVETSYEEVPLLQKRIIRIANERAKPVITATQMLKSMVESPHP